MRPGLNLFVVLLAALLPGPPVVQSIPATGDAKSSADLRYLLVRRAGSPEKNYYELSRTAQLLEPQLFTDQLISQYQPSPKHYGFDIMTDSTARYGVYQAWNVRVLGISDSVKSPTSTKDSVYVLIYPRNPDWIFCAKRYKAVSLKAGTRNIIYTDFQDGRENVIELSADWPRPWQIYEIEILKANAFVEIWQASKRSRAGVH